MALKLIRFRYPWRQYNAGDQAGFEPGQKPGQADWLIAQSYAVAALQESPVVKAGTELPVQSGPGVPLSISQPPKRRGRPRGA